MPSTPEGIADFCVIAVVSLGLRYYLHGASKNASAKRVGRLLADATRRLNTPGMSAKASRGVKQEVKRLADRQAK